MYAVFLLTVFLAAAPPAQPVPASPTDSLRVDLSGLVPSGNPDAPVQVVIYASFDCPYCRTAATALRHMSLSMPDTLSLWFKNYPLSQDDRAVPAALAYLAAERQGKGWQMFDMLFGSTSTLTDAALASCADGAGVDLDQYHSDIQDDALMRRIRTEKAEGVAFGFQKVPGILVNGKPYIGKKTKPALLHRIEEEAKVVLHSRE